MDIDTLRITLRNAIHDDSTTQTWCTDNYGQTHKVYGSIDIRKPPDSGEYPIVHIFPISMGGGYDLEQAEYELGVVCGINDSSTRTIPGKSNIVEYTGVTNIETFRQKVEDAISGAIPTGYFLSELSVDYEVIEFFPYFVTGMRLVITKEYYQGDNPFA